MSGRIQGHAAGDARGSAARALLGFALAAGALGCSTFDAHWLEERRWDGSVSEPARDAGAVDSGGAGSAGRGTIDAGLTDASAEGGPLDAGVDADAADAGDASEGGAATQRSIRITVAMGSVAEPLADFPLLVRISDDATLSIARDDGLDLYFTAEDRTSVLDAEFERWDHAVGTLVAWVRIPSLPSDAETVLYLHYGDGVDHSAEFTPANVWDAEFEGVWHLSSDADSTSHAHDGTNSDSTDVAGAIGSARAFAGSADIAMGTGKLPNEQYFTITAWVSPDYAGCNMFCGVLTNAEPGLTTFRGNSLYLRASDGAIATWEDVFRVSNDSAENGVWTFVALTTNAASSGSASSSVNGSAWTEFYTGATASFVNQSDSELHIGRFAGMPPYQFSGVVDEVRVSSVQRSSAWIKAEYDNQRSDSTFLLLEAVE